MSGTAAFTTSVVINVIIALVVLLVFGYLRAQKKYEWAFMPRYKPDRWVKPRQRNGWVRPPTLPDGLYQWIPFLFGVSDDTLYESAGLDALMYVSFTSAMMKIFTFCSLGGMIVLMPLYAELGENEIENADGVYERPEGIDKISLSNIEEESDVLWATYIFGILFTAFACYEFKMIYLKWIMYRHRHLASSASKKLGLSVLVQYLPKNMQSDEDLAKFYGSVFKEKCSSAVVGRDLTALVKLKEKADTYKWKLQLATTKWETLQEKEKAGMLKKNKKAQRPQHRLKPLIGKKVDSIEWYTNEIEKLKKEIGEELKKEHPPLNQGIVTFNSAVAALSCEGIAAASAIPFAMMHRFAPEPRDIYWPNLKFDYKHRHIRALLMNGATFALVFLWIIPVTFVATLTTLSALSERIPFLEPIANSHPIIKGFLEGFLPGLALIIFNVLLPMILLVMARVEGIEALSWMQLSVFQRFFIFIIVNNFLAVTLAGAVFDQLDTIIEDPTSIVELLGTAVPKTATFFTSYVMIASFTILPIKLLNPGVLVVGTLLKKTIAKTPAQQERVEAPKFEKYGVEYGKHMLVVVVGFCYSAISPIILPFAAMYFAMAFLVAKYRALYVVVPTDEGGGVFWPEVFKKIRIAMLVAHITLAGVLGLKKHYIVGPIAISIAIVSWIYTGSLSKTYDVRGRYLTAEMAVLVDEGEGSKVGASSPKSKRSSSLSSLNPFKSSQKYAAPSDADKGESGYIEAPATAKKNGAEELVLPGDPYAQQLVANVTLEGEKPVNFEFGTVLNSIHVKTNNSVQIDGISVKVTQI